MTQINKLVMQGFKSFAKRTELPFSKKFNMVLGANGSGKSNILDGLCFVLGRLSGKDLRTDKLSHLIYNGGKAKQPAGKAEVCIFFDNSNKVFPVEESVIKLGRIIKPSGQSVYKINDKTRTRQEILDMMALARINPNGYNIVLQGDINRFVEMSSEDRRQVVEEIAGIGVYEDKKKKALAELERVETRIRDAEILLAERKTHLKELKNDRDQALKYRELSEKIKQYKATYVHLRIKSKSNRKGGLDNEIRGLNEEIETTKKVIEKLKASVEGKKKEVSSITEEAEKRGETEQLSLHKAIEQARVYIATSANRINSIKTDLENVAERRKQLQSDLDGIGVKVKDLTQKSAELNKSRSGLIKEKTRLENEVKKLRGTGDDVAKLEEQLIKLDKESESLQAEIHSSVELKQDLLRKKDQLEFNIAAVEDSMKKVDEVQKTHKSELQQLEAKRKSFKKTVLELNMLLPKDSSISVRLGEVKRQLYSVGEELTKLKMQHLAASERTHGTNAVRAIIEQDEIRGIHGTVSQLGTVQSKYSTALDAAAGARTNSVVVDSDAVAARCIKYLKAKKLGRATFLPLNKMKKSQPSEVRAGNGVHGLAVKLVSFDSKYKDVFNYVFGSTVVVESIETARKIGVGTQRMVTLEGDLTEISGAMHGGFRQKSMAFQEGDLNRNISDAEKRMSDLEILKASIETDKAETEESITALREQKAVFEGEIIKAEKSLHLESGDADASKKNKAELSAELKKTIAELDGPESRIEELNKKIAAVKTEKMNLREKVSSLGNPAVIAELAALVQKIQELNDEVMRTDNEINNSKVQTEDILAQEKTRIIQIIKQMSKEEANFKAERDGLVKDIAARKNELSESEVKAKKFKAEHRSLFEKRDKIGESIRSDEEKIIRKQEQINTVEVKINNVTVKASEITGELAGLQQEFSSYSDVKLLQNVNEEQLKGDIYRYERSVAQMGNVNLKALEVYEDVEKQYSSLLGKKETLAKEKEDVISMMNEVESKKKDLFMNTFNTLNTNFKETFTELSSKGSEAYLMLENEESPFDAGVRVRVRIAGDKFMDIRSLSGGEKSMTALAFIFSIQEYEPASFYIFDEVDAALDKKNSDRLAQLLKKYSEKAQYIVISHNDNVVTQANTLYGVSMDEHGISNVVSLKI